MICEHYTLDCEEEKRGCKSCAYYSEDHKNNNNNLEKIKEYDKYVLFRDKNTGIRECIMKTDIEPVQNEKKGKANSWERRNAFDRFLH